MRIHENLFTFDGNTVAISVNANKVGTQWQRNDNTKDAYLIELVDSASDQGYVSIKRADGATGYITWTEIIKFNFDGALILPALASIPSSPGADNVKLHAYDHNGRTTLSKRDSVDNAYLLEGKGVSRIWRQPTQPSGAKVGDIWFKG